MWNAKFAAPAYSDSLRRCGFSSGADTVSHTATGGGQGTTLDLLTPFLLPTCSRQGILPQIRNPRRNVITVIGTQTK